MCVRVCGMCVSPSGHMYVCGGRAENLSSPVLDVRSITALVCLGPRLLDLGVCWALSVSPLPVHDLAPTTGLMSFVSQLTIICLHSLMSNVLKIVISTVYPGCCFLDCRMWESYFAIL